MQSTNLLHSFSNPILSCVLTPAVFPSKEHESKVPEPPPLIYTAPAWVFDILTLIKFMRDMRMWLNKTKNHLVILWIEQNTTWTFQKQMTETTQMQI